MCYLFAENKVTSRRYQPHKCEGTCVHPTTEYIMSVYRNDILDKLTTSVKGIYSHMSHRLISIGANNYTNKYNQYIYIRIVM